MSIKHLVLTVLDCVLAWILLIIKSGIILSKKIVTWHSNK